MSVSVQGKYRYEATRRVLAEVHTHIHTPTTHAYGPSDAAAAVTLHVGTRKCMQKRVFRQMLGMLASTQDY